MTLPLCVESASVYFVWSRAMLQLAAQYTALHKFGRNGFSARTQNSAAHSSAIPVGFCHNFNTNDFKQMMRINISLPSHRDS